MLVHTPASLVPAALRVNWILISDLMSGPLVLVLYES